MFFVRIHHFWREHQPALRAQKQSRPLGWVNICHSGAGQGLSQVSRVYAWTMAVRADQYLRVGLDRSSPELAAFRRIRHSNSGPTIHVIRSRFPSCAPFFGGRVPQLKQTTEKGYPYSNLFTGGPCAFEVWAKHPRDTVDQGCGIKGFIPTSVIQGNPLFKWRGGLWWTFFLYHFFSHSPAVHGCEILVGTTVQQTRVFHGFKVAQYFVNPQYRQ